jgi:hypothetical protein
MAGEGSLVTLLSIATRHLDALIGVRWPTISLSLKTLKQNIGQRTYHHA